jgi:chromosome segregation ATPase
MVVFGETPPALRRDCRAALLGILLATGPFGPAMLSTANAAETVQKSDQQAQAPDGTSPGAPSVAEFEPLLKATDELEAALAEARARLKELGAAAETAAGELRQRLDDTARENDRLAGALAATEQKLQTAVSDHQKAEARIAELTQGAEQAKATIADLQRELGISQQKIEIANSSRSEAEARLIEMQKNLDGAGAEATRLRQDLARTRHELQATNAVLADAQTARDAARSEIDGLKAQLVEALSSIIAKLQSKDARIVEPSKAGGTSG